MRLKTLVINGFKSFADKTVIDFHTGVTGIVGPNGCGKSNVVDAVRWVLGETSAKALRGGEMADVIFNGTDKRKPLGLAEVSLTFADCEKHLGVDYNEVQIARRVFRDGKGEYEMNGTPCRLKDINKLFMDTGVGRNMYSIMEQGKIDMLLSAKPEDRRMVFEEAAGITKSKAEKKEALRKLEYTEGNLVRVTDILTEMKRQMGSAQRQASKARRFQDLHKDVLVLDTHFHFKKYSELSAEKSELETSVGSLRLRGADLETELEREENGLSESRAELTEMEAQIGGVRNQLNQIQSQINAANYRISYNGERCQELEQLIQQCESEILSGNERMLEQEEELRRVVGELEEVRQTLDDRQQEMEEHQRTATRLREERTLLERTLQEARQTLHTSEGVIISAQAEINSHTAQNEADRQRQEQLQRDLNVLEEEKAVKEREEAELKAQAEELATELEGLQLDLNLREREAQELEAELEVLNRKIREAHRLFSEKESMQQVLRGLVSSGEGLETGTQHILQNYAENGVSGLLSNYIEPTDASFIPAVEAALEGHLQSVLVQNAGLASEILTTLKSGAIGSAVVLPMDLMRRGATAQMQTLPDGAVAWALDRVKARENVASVVFQLLGNVCIAPDLETAIRLKREMPDVAFATMGGEFICAAGTIRGGAKSGAADSILQRQAQLRQLDVDVVELEKALAVLESEQSGLQQRQQELRSEVVEKREFLQIRRTSESALLGQLGQVHRETAAFASKFESIQWEYSELMKRQEALSRKIDEATARRNRAEEEMETCRTLASTAVDALELKRREETEAFDHLNDTKTTLAVDQRHLQALQEQQGPMETRRREIEESLAKRRRDIEAHQEKITTAQEETDHLTSSVEEARTQVEELTHVLESRSAERSVRAQDLAQRDSALAGLRKQVSKLAEQRGNEEVRCTQLGLRVENLLNSAQERYRVNLEAFEVDAHALLSSINSQKAAQSRVDRRRGSLSVAEDEAGESPVAEVVASVDSVSDEDAAAFAEDGPDWDFVEGCIAELRQRLDSMGPVNLDAIQEFEELEERFNFLQKENDDLVNAKAELMQIIAQINNESKRRFVETFVKVRDNFRNTFKELFGQGGQADLIIADEEDPLESGIEIIAKPPGKKPQSITLLSGGERSMTAVALMFSIYMVKPSPFCILDELDAPLDESNIGRFVRMLDKFIENSQFVIVTHNKRTMRRADVLYGVTMEEFGVSKPIGMRMSDNEKTEIQEQEERLLAEAAAKAAEEEAKLSEEDRQIKPVRTGTTNSWVEAMSET